jgi:hypothetical protein
MIGTNGMLHPATHAQGINRYRDRSSIKNPNIFCNHAQHHMLFGVAYAVCLYKIGKWEGANKDGFK